MEEFYHLCRLCLKDSHRYCNIFESCLIGVINQVYELDMCLNDGLPVFICVQCLSKVKEFLRLKKEAHKGRSALLYLKTNIEARKFLPIFQKSRVLTIQGDNLQQADLQSWEYENFSKGNKITSPYPVKLPDYVRTSENIVKEEPRQVGYDADDAIVTVSGIYQESAIDAVCTEEEDPLAVGPPSIKEESLDSRASETVSATFEGAASDVGGNSFNLHFTGSTIKNEIDNDQDDTFGSESGFGQDTAVNDVWIEEVKYQPESQDPRALSLEQGMSAGSSWSNGDLTRLNNDALQSQPQLKTTFDCLTCGKSFKSQRSLTCHGRLHIKNKPYRCAHCLKGFDKKGFLKFHLVYHRGREGCYPCDTCGKVFKQKNNLDAHIRTHTGAQPYQCHLCGKKFSQKSNLNSHVKIHTGDRPFHCHLCSKKFKLKSHLNKHVTTHSGAKPFECHLCSKRFTHKFSLRGHLLAHNQVNYFECTLCDARFITKATLRQHMKAHDAGKTYECPLCFQKFVDVGGLKNHFKTHVGAESFECPICGEKFSLKGSLTKHLNYHHGSKTFACDVCGRRYSQKGSLDNHLRTHEQGRGEVGRGAGTVPGMVTTVRGVVATFPGTVATVPGTVTMVPGMVNTVTMVPDAVTTVPGVGALVPDMITMGSGAVTTVPGPVAIVPGMVSTVPSMVTPVRDAVAMVPGVTMVPGMAAMVPGTVNVIPSTVLAAPGTEAEGAMTAHISGGEAF